MERELRRNEEEGMIGGVCAGLAEYLNVEKIWVRLFFVLSIFFSFFGVGIVGFVVYVLIWIIVPKKPLVYPNYKDTRQTYVGGTPFYKKDEARKRDRRTAGAVLLGLGVILLIIQLRVISWSFLFKLWPVVFIISGISVISSAFYVKSYWKADPVQQDPADIVDMDSEDKEE